MIPIIPYKHFTFLTPLTIEQAMHLVSSAIAPRRTLNSWAAPNPKGFEGTVTERGFKIEKTHYSRNSFIPVLYGKFTPTEGGTKVTAYLTLDLLVLVFFAFLLAAFGALTVLFAISKGWANANVQSFLLGIGFLVGLFLLGFAPYAQSYEDFINRVFAAYVPDR